MCTVAVERVVVVVVAPFVVAVALMIVVTVVSRRRQVPQQQRHQHQQVRGALPQPQLFVSAVGCAVVMCVCTVCATNTLTNIAITTHTRYAVCGPSGAGKSTLIHMLQRDFPDAMGFSVSHTTRRPRPGEVDGVDYHFVERRDMERSIARGEFIEHALVHDNL